jgi:hypothetical protein
VSRSFAIVLGSALLAACGSKSALPEPSGTIATGGSGGTPSATGGSGGTPSATGGSGGTVVEQKCVLSPYADPTELLSFPEGDADTPLMVVLDKGKAGTGAKVAYAAISEDANFWHPELRVAELSASSSAATLTKNPVLYGFDAHAWGRMAHAPGQSSGFALAFYHADEANPNVTPAFKFRSFDPKAWSPGPEISVDPTGTVAYGFAASGVGYAAAYRGALDDGNAEPRVAVLDANGKTVNGPIAVAEATPYPGWATDVAWSGVSWLLVTSTDRIEVSRVAGETVVATAKISPLGASTPRRSRIASNGAFTWIAWSEAPPDPPDAPRTVRMARLDPQGNAVGEPLVLATDAHPAHAVSIAVTDFGVLVWWGEPGDEALPDSTPGRTRLIVHHLSGEGSEEQPPIELPATAFAYGLPPTLVTLDASIGALVSWGALSQGGGTNVTWLGRLRCN